MPSSPLQQRALDAGAFALLALSLALPSGYSVGAVMLLLLGLWRWPAALTGRLPRTAAGNAWALTIALMGLAWAMHIVGPDGRLITNSLGLDRCVKYGLVLLALPALWGQRPGTTALRWGCWLGAAGAGALALWQVLVQHQARADGHTNAIQFGNLALLLAAWSVIWAMQTADRRARAVGFVAALLGMAASLASGSRGGWVVLPLLLLLGLWLASPAPAQPRSRWRGVNAVVATLLACLLVAALPPVQQRVALAVHELQSQQPQRDNTSTGLRLAFWQQAWAMGMSAPWTGIGQTEYEARQRDAVARRQMPDQAIDYNHAHNEWLDMFAKRGLIGIAALALFYGVPGVLFWRRLRQPARAGEPAAAASARHAATLCGLTTVLGFVGFGMTQVMFAHNNGNLMYLLCVALWLAADRLPREAAR